MWYSFIYSTTFWIVFCIVAFLGFGRKIPFVGKLPVFNNKKTMLIVGVLGVLLTMGIFGTFWSSTGSLTAATGSVLVSDLQVTTNFATDTLLSAGSSIGEDSNIDDLINVRLNDTSANETSGLEEVSTGIITVTRTGNLDPISCPVVAHVSSFTGETAATMGNSVSYKIAEETTTGELEVYLADGGAASTSSPKEQTMLAFADGDATSTLGVAIEVDEEAHDAMSQYSSKDVVVDICGKPYTFRIHQMN